MSDAALSTEQPSVQPPTAHAEDRVMPAVGYGLHLLGLTHGLTMIIGLILAYVQRGSAGPIMESHYTFQIRTFWLAIWWFVIGGVLALVGGIFSIVLIGLPFLWLGVSIIGLVWFWYLARCIIGLVYLARGEAYPRPRNWLF